MSLLAIAARCWLGCYAIVTTSMTWHPMYRRHWPAQTRQKSAQGVYAYRERSSHEVPDLSISRSCSPSGLLHCESAQTYRLPVRISVLTAEPPVETLIDVSQNHGADGQDRVVSGLTVEAFLSLPLIWASAPHPWSNFHTAIVARRFFLPHG
ncbi:uncharacterized protein LY79DRAFT_579580 [Colletotrichum navitas]|uniref:Uncharacterized protein n=1 Tax=Colletotrichum navitas TaxID=681940 RepID=A0AAD8PZ71_9PEZI|nr:uncharacterized protein LY79DRAFT_579580 [Colletotrichum navitas]KAK1590834.1 hypothetical protein LY79DRAFT_579580 [Colletotrichum navitas]